MEHANGNSEKSDGGDIVAIDAQPALAKIATGVGLMADDERLARRGLVVKKGAMHDAWHGVIRLGT